MKSTLTPLLDLTGKTAIVTGGAVGIGFGIALRLAEAGASVMVVDLHEENAKKAAAALQKKKYKADYATTDVSVEKDVANMVQKTMKRFGSIDILVNNAGIYPNNPVMSMGLSEWEKVIHVNLRSVYLCTKKVADVMIQKGDGGKIINVTSVDALHPTSVGLAHYDASKHGVWGFTKNIALELAPHKIWVNAIAPGGVATPGVLELQKKMKMPKGVDTKKVLAEFLQKIPMQRMGEPDDIGKVALFLASEMSSYMTGSQVVVDGGVLLR